MAYATQITISTGNKVSLNYQSQEVNVTLTYQLEREDTDLLTVDQEKATELAKAHRTAWQTLRDAKVSAVNDQAHPPRTITKEEATPNENTVMTAGEAAEPLPHDSSPLESSQATETLEEPPTPLDPITPGQRAALLLLLTKAKWSEESRQEYLRKQFSCCSVDDLTAPQASLWLLELQRTEREVAQQRRVEKVQRNGTS